MKSSKDKPLKIEVKQVHGFLNDRKSKALATISYNDEPAKLNVRSCWTDKEGNLKFGSGITLDEHERDELTSLLVSAKNTGELQKVDKDGKKAVNFTSIFQEAEGIVSKRDAGETTKDGFIVLRKKPGVKLKK